MNHETSVRIAWTLFAACVPLYFLTLLFAALHRDLLGDVLLVIAFLVTPGVGALVASHRPQNAVGWLLLAAGLGFGLAGIISEYAALSEERSLPLGAEVGPFANAAFFVSLVSGAVFIPLLFPNGRLPSRRWRIVARVAGLSLILGVIGYVIEPGRLDISGVELGNPYGIEGADWVLGLGYVLLFAAAPAAALSLILRFRSSRGEERQQIKWLVFVAALLPVTFAAGPGVQALWDTKAETPLIPFYVLLSFGLAASIGIAILRHRLYDIDRIINRTLTYGLLTATLAMFYLGLVVGLQTLLQPLNGGSDLALVITTLAVAALFLPARRTLQRGVDRRFNRRAYNAAQTIDAFGARLRDQVDLDTLHYELLAVVDETIAPERASLWLRDMTGGSR